jgi:hypothetical protein
MQVIHPAAERDAATPSAVTINGETFPIVNDRVECPDDVATAIADAWARRFNVPADGLIVREEDGPPDDSAGTCTAVTNADDVCGRDLPCRYHSDSEPED